MNGYSIYSFPAGRYYIGTKRFNEEEKTHSIATISTNWFVCSDILNAFGTVSRLIAFDTIIFYLIKRI